MGTVFKILNKALNNLNLHIHLVRISKIHKPEPDEICINIGAGGWRFKGWINLDKLSEWYSADQKNQPNLINYDIRVDDLPFENNSITAIFCSHVIEHVETKYVERMFSECFRVLRVGGVLRIACPDAEFLYQLCKKNTDYFPLYNDPFFKSKERRLIDFLVFDIATQKTLNYKHSLNKIDYKEAFEKMEMNEFLNYMTSDCVYREEFPGDHVSYWTFDKCKEILAKTGFDFIIHSKYAGSCCNRMKSVAKFDTTSPSNSLYVEAVKT